MGEWGRVKSLVELESQILHKNRHILHNRVMMSLNIGTTVYKTFITPVSHKQTYSLSHSILIYTLYYHLKKLCLDVM